VRRRALSAALVACTALGLATAAGAAADESCAGLTQLFAVAADTGELIELAGCASPASIAVVGRVDAGDWRTARHVFAANSGPVTVVYAVTTDGRLEARRQDGPGQPLGQPVQVESKIDWSGFTSLVAAGPGYLVGQDRVGVQQYRHVGWSTGGTAARPGPMFFAQDTPEPLDLMTLTAARPGQPVSALFRESAVLIWRTAAGMSVSRHDGHLPAARVVPAGALLYGIADGAVVQLSHPLPSPEYNCPFNSSPWQATVSLPGGWARVVAPVGGLVAGAWPDVPDIPPSSPTGEIKCPDPTAPYEWQ
jgi:hypothetical protein